VPTRTDTRDRIVRELAAQPADSVATARIASVFAAGAFPGSRLVEAACTRTACRARVAHDTTEAAEHFESRLPFTAPFRGHALIEHGGTDTTPETTVYLATDETASRE